MEVADVEKVDTEDESVAEVVIEKVENIVIETEAEVVTVEEVTEEVSVDAE